MPRCEAPTSFLPPRRSEVVFIVHCNNHLWCYVFIICCKLVSKFLGLICKRGKTGILSVRVYFICGIYFHFKFPCIVSGSNGGSFDCICKQIVYCKTCWIVIVMFAIRHDIIVYNQTLWNVNMQEIGFFWHVNFIYLWLALIQIMFRNLSNYYASVF